MRICLVTQHDPADFDGGTELVVRAHAKALRERGHEVWIVAGTEEPHAGRDTLVGTLEGMKLVRIPRLPEEGYDLELARPRIEALAVHAVDGAEVVHVHHWSTLSSGLVRALAAQTHVAITLHDAFSTCARFFRHAPTPGVACPTGFDAATCARCVAPDAGGLEPSELTRRIERREASFRAELEAAHLLLAPSESHARRMRELWGLADDRVHSLPHGLCRALRRPRGGPIWSGDRALRVLHFGNLCEEKGTLDLVKILQGLPPGAVELDLVGRPLSEELVEAIDRERGELSVRLHGPYRDRDLEQVAGQCDLAAFPSRVVESYGLVIDEALALGLPVWVPDVGAPRERVCHAGRVLRARDPGAWRDAFRSLIDEPAQLAREVQAVPRHLRGAGDAAGELAHLYANLLEVWT